jgi:GNAT superfamily N-acetyltransferase
MVALRALMERMARWILGKYSCFKIYSLDLNQDLPIASSDFDFAEVTAEQVKSAERQELRERAWYGGEGSYGFGAYDGDKLVCLQWYWYGERYKCQRNFWPLARNEAKAVEIYTLTEYRGQGIATFLKMWSAVVMKERGFRRLYNRIWHSNHSSIRASQKSGWGQIATVIQLHRYGLRFDWRLQARWKERLRMSFLKSSGPG